MLSDPIKNDQTRDSREILKRHELPHSIYPLPLTSPHNQGCNHRYEHERANFKSAINVRSREYALLTRYTEFASTGRTNVVVEK